MTASAPAAGTPVDWLLDGVIGRLVDLMLGLIMAGLVVMVFSGVIARYIANYSLAWSDEIGALLFVWTTMMGSVAAMRRRTHMAIGFLPRRLGPFSQRMLGFAVLAAIAFFLVFMVREGIDLVRLTRTDYSPVLEFPIALSYLSLPVAGALMLLYVAREAWLLRAAHGWGPNAEDAEDD